jgi:hypothetical protein
MRALIVALGVSAIIIFSTSFYYNYLHKEFIPGVVVAQFEKEYGQAQQIVWAPKNENFEVAFRDQGLEKKALYSNSGVQLRVTYIVRHNEVPGPVFAHVRQQYPDMVIEYVTYVETLEARPYYIVKIKDPVSKLGPVLPLGRIA